MAEPFDECVSAWNDSPSKAYRLERLCASLGLSVDAVRTSATSSFTAPSRPSHEAQRYRTERAIMPVHSSNARDASFGDFHRFAAAMGDTIQDTVPGDLVRRVEGPDE